MEPCRSGSARVPVFRSSPSCLPARLHGSAGSGSGQSAGGVPPPAPLLSRRRGQQGCYYNNNNNNSNNTSATTVSRPHQQRQNYQHASEDTLSHLIAIIEQLKSKDKVISQLERDLGHPAALATGPVSMATEVTRPSSSGHPSSSIHKMETPPLSPHPLLSGLQQVFQRLHGTGMTSFPLGGEEKGAVEGFAGLEKEILGLHDRAQALDLDRQTLLDKIKDFEGKNKQLVEKNKRFLEKNIELTAHNRCLKDGSHTLQQHNRKLQEEAEECRRRQCELARELQRVRAHSLDQEAKAEEVDSLKQQIADHVSSITLLRQACTDKDRRIELIQHRKKRRRLIRSQEKIQGVKETFYGYDDDDNDASIDSETSLSSVSVSTISEEDGCDELSREELERSHRQMLREHLQLERSHSLLQAHTGSFQDPHRELQTRSQLQADLFSAQCRVELLEKEVRSLQARQQHRADSQDVALLLKERDDLLTARHGLQLKLEQVDGECSRLRQELRQAEERAEDLEFRILELEENPPCQEHELPPNTPHPHQGSDPDPDHDNSIDDLHPQGHDLDDTSDLEGRGLDLCEADQAEVAECIITKTVASPVVECVPGQSPSGADQSSSDPEIAAGDGRMEFVRLRGELKAALERQGVHAEYVLKDLGALKEMEQKVTSLERMGMDMQSKVIALQQEKDSLEERLMRGAPLSLNAEVERRQNLELKEEISRLTSAKEECSAENSCLAKQLEESEHLVISLQEQLKEFLEPSGSISICGLVSGQQNKTDVDKAGEDTGSKLIVPPSNKYVQTDKPPDPKRRDNKSRSRSRDSERAEIQALTQKVKTLQTQLKKLEAENQELAQKSMRSSNDSSSDDDDPSQPAIKHKPKQKVKTLERQIQVLHSENIRLVDKLGGYSSSGAQLGPEEVIEKIVELEDYSTDLQDRLREVEGHERQTRDKLRVAEQTINELELSEAQYRDKCDELSQQERETKKQLHSLQTTGRELREIILDKEVLEQALKEKVEFLEKVEAQSTQRITELEAIERSLREQLEQHQSPNVSGGSGGAGGGLDPHHQALKDRLAAAEQEVRALRLRNGQLEEEEEILRENWRRVADEDANRIRCLEDKVRVLEMMNQELKTKVAEAQDFVVINSGPAQGSLADELSASAGGIRTQARPVAHSPGGSDDGEDSGEDSPRKKVSKLKRQLSLLEEEKNGKIANLQERLADLKENEIKLSETLAEMEMTERELRAKLALYESSEVTVEKMLVYQDKIDELRTSQESLLDQLETMESQEVTLQEQLEETERRLKGKILTLEVEMKNLKQKELKGNARIRELEKQEAEMTEKAARQAEKENGLYVRISGLMDQVKELKVKVTEQEKKLAEKDERCRKVASLEAKFLQIEGAYREKVTTLESSLSEAQSQLSEEEKSHEKTREELDVSLQARDQEHTQRVFILEEMFAQKEKGLSDKIAALESSLSEQEAANSEHAQNGEALREKITALESRLSERDRAMSEHNKVLHDKDNRIAQMEMELSGKESEITELQDMARSQQSKECELEKSVSAKDEHIAEIKKDLTDKADRIDCLEKYLSEKESRVAELEKEVAAIQKGAAEKDNIIADLERDLSEKVVCISELERDLDRKEERITEAEKGATESKTLKAHLAELDGHIDELEKKLSEKDGCITSLGQEVSRSESQRSQLEKEVSRKDGQISTLEAELSVRALKISQLETDIERRDDEVSRMETGASEKDTHIRNLESEIAQKDSHVAHLERALLDRERQIRECETQLETQGRESSSKLEQALQVALTKDTHIAEMEEQVIHMSTTLSELEKKVDEKDAHISGLEAQLVDKDSITSQQVSELHSKLETEQNSATTKLCSLEEELVAVKSQLSQSDAKSGDYSSKLVLVERELEEERAKAESLKLHTETLEVEKEHLQAELAAKVSDLETQLRDQDSDFEAQLSVREDEFRKACSSLDAECESLRSDLTEKGRVIERLESTKNDLLSKIENLKDRERELANKLSEAELDLSTLQLQKDGEVKETAMTWETRLKDAEHDKEMALEKAAKLEADLQSSSQTIQQQLEKMAELQTDLNKAKSEIVTLQSSVSQLQVEEAESRSQKEQFVQQETMLKTRVSQVEAQLQDQERQNVNSTQLLAEKEKLEETLLSVRAELSDSCARNVQLQGTVTELKRHSRSVQQEMADLWRQVKELEVSQEKEKELQKELEENKRCMRELESEISGLKDDKESALAKAVALQNELDVSREAIQKLEADIQSLGQAEETLKSQISMEQSMKLETDRRLSQVSEEATSQHERVTELLKEVEEKKEEIGLLKEEVLMLKHELETQQGLSLNIEQKDQELHSLKEREEDLQKREARLQERIASMESQMARQQEDHSSMCQKLHDLEQREKELLEQITDVEQNVIVPLEAENSELKEEVASLKQQTDALNLQIDKQEEQTREDCAELDTLRQTVNELQLSRTEAQTKLDNVKLELRHHQSEKEALENKVADLEALNESMTDQLKNSRVEMSKLESKHNKDVKSQEAQTDSSAWVSETQWQNLQQKLTVLQDAESKFMSRILDLEEHEVQLSEELESVKSQLKEKDQQLKHQLSLGEHRPDTSNTSVDTEDLQETSTTSAAAKVPELFARVQELESTNQRLSVNLEQATAGEADRKQLTDRLHLLEVAEERLMDRVIELEENEVSLSTQLDRSKHRAKVADQLEEEVSLLLQQEDEWKEKVAALTADNAQLTNMLETLQSQVGEERSRNEDLSFRVEAEQKQLQDAQTELRLAQTKLQAVRGEYEEKLSALEHSERTIERQLDSKAQGETALKQEVQMLRADLEDVCERYKSLELENSRLQQDHAKVLTQLQEAEARCLPLSGGSAREPALQAAQAHSLQAVRPSPALSHPVVGATSAENASSSVSSSVSSLDPQYSSPSAQPPQVCSKMTLQMMPSSSPMLQEGAPHSVSSKSSHSVTQTAQLKLGLAKPRSKSDGSGVGDGLPFNKKRGSVDSSDYDDSDSSGVNSGSAHSGRILTMRDVLKENASLKAQLKDLRQSGSPTTTTSTATFSSSHADNSGSLRRVSEADRAGQAAETLALQTEISGLVARVAELEQSLKEAEGAVQEVVTVVRTRSVHTLEQKIETIQQTIHTQSPAWSLHQELLELLTSQADLQKQVSHLMETEHNLRSTLKEVEDELARVKSEAGTSALGAHRHDSGRRFSLQSRLSRFGGGISSTKAQSEIGRGQVDISQKSKEQWLERQVADLQLAKSNLERRLHEAERRLAFRPRPTSGSREELQFRVEQLQGEQGEWRKKVEDLQALNSHYLKEKLELASERDSLERRLHIQSPSAGREVSVLFARGRREEPLGSSGSVSEAEPTTTCSGQEAEDTDDAMRDKPEDVLHKRIKELENLESYLRQQLSEVETDREQLHEIARKDKATIHEQNVRLRELMLQERNLRSQVSGLEDSERSLYSRCGHLEDSVSRLEDRVHELEVHERRLKELVRKLKLDEEVWLSRSGDLTASMEQLSSSEVSLRRTVHDLQVEKGALADRAEYLEVRVKELESLETTLVQRLKNYENVEASLQNRLHSTENSEAAAHSKASELDVINMDLSSRLQRAVEENAVLSQHVAQQQGHIHDMDRRLQSASDAQVSLTQHVDSLQKSEAALQKKVREYELRDIDAQARVRELEQTEEILKDKINQLQRSENRLKSRLAELEIVSSQVLETLPAGQQTGSKQQVPQQLEECQRRIVVLQRQLEAAQAEQRAGGGGRGEDSSAPTVTVPTAAYVEMRSRAALLEAAESQVAELEKLNTQLSHNVLQLRQGKGSCGHEVELEVLKRRLHSYQNTVQELKHHLSEGQVPSLRASDLGQGPESEDLPARRLQGLESERVLHSVRGLTQPPGATHAHHHFAQAHSGLLQSAPRAPGAVPTAVASDPPQEGEREEENRWRQVEQKRHLQGAEGEPRGASPSITTPAITDPPPTAAPSGQEELMMGVSLPSESERGLSQNDTDSERSGVTHPHLRRMTVGSTTTTTTTTSATHRGSPSHPATPVGGACVPAPRGGGGRGEAQPPPMPTGGTSTKKPPATTSSSSPSARQQQRRTNSGFVTDDSFYLPSSAPQSSEESEGEAPPPPLPSSAPPGMQSSPLPPLPSHSQSTAPTTPQSSSFAARAEKTFVMSAGTLPSGGQKREEAGRGGGEGAAGQRGRLQTTPLQPAEIQTTSVVGLNIRQRIAQIERQLKENPSPKAGSKAEDEDVFTWKAKATENARLLGAAEREGKQLKEDINKLEKDLEEKRRYIYIFEKWILDAEEVLKNKNKKNDRDLVQQLQMEVKHLKQDLGNAGYRKDDMSTDPAALKTELDRRDRELTAKRTEVEGLAGEVERWRQEAGSVETMRKNALDALRLLETEVSTLQDADTQLKQLKDEYNTMRGQYDEVNIQKIKAVSAVHTLRAKVTRLAKKCQEKDELIQRLSEELRGGRGRSSSLLEELTRLEAMAGGEEYNRPLSPLDLITGPATSDSERLLSERIPEATETFMRWPSSSSLGDPHDPARTGGGDKTSVMSSTLPHRPKSAEQVRKPLAGQGVTSDVGGGDTLCVAIMDYTPDAATRSGHRHLELSLKDGDQVRVRGPVDRRGYCEAEVGGRVGLVPASYLYPLTDSAATYRPASLKQGRHKVGDAGSTEQIVQMFKELDDPRLLSGLSVGTSHPPPLKSLPPRHSSTTATQTRQRPSLSKPGAVPEAPRGLHIREVEGSSVVLSWQPPSLDPLGCSNGCKVVGYRIYLNGRVCQQPHNPRLSHTRVEGVRSDRPQQLAIQTLAASGQVSARVELTYQAGGSLPRPQRQGDEESDTDLSSILNSIQYKTGRRRTVMGLYDYDPEKQTPGDYPACELAFSVGDLMLVYGEERQDGFYHGEKNGKRGLVPACFVEVVNQGPKSVQKPGTSNGTTSPPS